jgi:Fe-S-cluster containining protein
MRLAMGPLEIKPPKPQGTFCPYLDMATKRCTVHPRRPMICRLYGMTEDLRCPFGCKPTPRYLTRDEARYYVKESIRIG